MSKYFSIDLTTISAGLTHHIFNLETIIKYCYFNNYKLLIPEFELAGSHNNGKLIKTNLNKYINFDTLKVENKLYKIYFEIENKEENNEIIFIDKKKYYGGLLANDPLFSELKYIPIKFDYVDYILNISKNIINELKNYLCIHVRRGDRITNKQIDIDTSPNNIIKKIKKYDNKKIYIMTNENVDFFNELNKLYPEYNIYFYINFPILIKLKKTDNYLLFCIENEICKYAEKKISTFKTPNHEYIDYLSEQPGWQ